LSTTDDLSKVCTIQPFRSVRLWQDLRELAMETAVREPFLRPLMERLVLSRSTTEEMLSAVLVHRLTSAGTSDLGLLDLVHETLMLDERILCLAEADLLAVNSRDPACSSYLHALLSLKGFQALQSHRIAHALWTRGRRDVALWLSNQVSMTLGVDIHPAVPIGKGVMLDHGSGIVIGETAVVEDDVSILQGVTLGGTGNERGDRHPKVRRGAMLGAGAKVLGNVEIGCMSKIGAGSVVVRSVPPYSTVAGIPARVVRQREPEATPSN
jgi:serine O-acetyltransferase